MNPTEQKIHSTELEQCRNVTFSMPQPEIVPPHEATVGEAGVLGYEVQCSRSLELDCTPVIKHSMFLGYKT
jgi:hypothetical protein